MMFAANEGDEVLIDFSKFHSGQRVEVKYLSDSNNRHDDTTTRSGRSTSSTDDPIRVDLPQDDPAA
jgi:hypothetical protein